MKRKVGDRVIIKSKYFNPYNDLEGVINFIDDDYIKISVKLDDVEGSKVFDKTELKSVKEKIKIAMDKELTGAELIAEERARQIYKLGYLPESDLKENGNHQLVRAALCFAYNVLNPGTFSFISSMWPWKNEFKNSHDKIRQLTKAGALLAAEIDRLKRLKK